jgi:hypothetical protein
MIPVVDLESTLSQLAEQDPAILPRLVVAEESPEYPGCLVFQTFGDPQDFYRRYHEWVSRYLVLNGLHNLQDFVELLQADGHTLVFGPSAAPVLEDYERWSAPLEIEGYALRPFQQFSLNRFLERARTGADNNERLSFWNWSAGAGKSYCSGAGIKALLDADDIDFAIVCTLAKLKENVRRTYVNDAGLLAIINDHSKPATRHQRYRDAIDEGVNVLVMNYEKLWVDYDALAELTAGRRILFVFDEAHKLINEGSHNKARKAMDKLARNCWATIWPMSATVVGGNPLRFRDLFSLDGHPHQNPLGTKAQFVSRYADRVREIPIKSRSGGRFTFTAYDWSLTSLQDIRHRIADRAMAVRKTDPGVRSQFKGIECLPEIIQPTPATSELFEIITAEAARAKDREESLAPYYLMLRIAAINPGALTASNSEIAQEIVARHPALFDAKHSAKIEVLNEKLESIRESEDKAVVFCHWTQLGLLPLARHITVPHVLHYGTGQSARESQAAQDQFKSDPNITAFCSSDAGTHGLNLQCARYVVNIDPTYSYDDLAQRNARIDRADSHLDGLTAYVLITEGSVEERVWDTCNQRRELAAATQGTQEELSYGGEPAVSRGEMADLSYLIFGK